MANFELSEFRVITRIRLYIINTRSEKAYFEETPGRIKQLISSFDYPSVVSLFQTKSHRGKDFSFSSSEAGFLILSQIMPRSCPGPDPRVPKCIFYKFLLGHKNQIQLIKIIF